MIVVASLFFASRRGLAWRWLRERRETGGASNSTPRSPTCTCSPRQHGSLEHGHSDGDRNAMGVRGGVLAQPRGARVAAGSPQRLDGDEWALDGRPARDEADAALHGYEAGTL